MPLALALLCAAAPEPVKYIPRHEELKYTFGGHPPVLHLKPGTRLVSWTEDCFDGAVTKPGQLPPKVAPPGHDHPHTGPLHVDGAEVRAGNTVYLGVRVPGALFSFGDGHFGMGEGEIIGTAVEGAMNVELTVDLVKHRETPWPRIENGEFLMSVGAARPLEDAARIAFKDMVQWVRARSGLSGIDAYQFVSQASLAKGVQIVDPLSTVLVQVPQQRLPTNTTR